jgi:hypothetical protein
VARTLARKRKKNVKTNSDEVVTDQIYTSLDPKDKSTHNVFGDSVKQVLELYVEQIGNNLQRQSERNVPQTRFSQGLTKNEHMVKACEEQGILLLLLLFLSSTADSTLLTSDKDELESMGVKRLSNYIGTIEHMILFEEFMKCTSGVTKRDLDTVHTFVCPLMERYKETVDRDKGNQLKIIKFHLMMHVPDDIRRFGLAANFSSGPNEPTQIAL